MTATSPSSSSGMRINQPWRLDLWVPALRAMGPMLTELHGAPRRRARASTGFLGHQSLFGAGGPTIVQYWRSVDDIYAYAHDPDRAHRPAWLEFYRRGRAAAGRWGSGTRRMPSRRRPRELYVSMPPTGLGRVRRRPAVAAASCAAGPGELRSRQPARAGAEGRRR